MHSHALCPGGPERAHNKSASVSQKFDIWSLGCVFSEAATWLILGYRGVELFTLVRKSLQLVGHNIHDDDKTEDSDLSDQSDDELKKIRGFDRFHDGSDISKTVTDWHEHLRCSARACDPITVSILKMVEEKMLKQDATKRLSAAGLVEEMRTLLENAKKRLDLSTPMSKDEPPKPLGYRSPTYFSVAINQEQQYHTQVLKKRLATEEKEKGRKNRLKSKRLIAVEEPLGDLEAELDSEYSDLSQGSIVPTLGSDGLAGRRARTMTIPRSRATGFLLGDSIHHPSDSDMQPLVSQDGLPFINYTGARKLLEKMKWVSGTLEKQFEDPRPDTTLKRSTDAAIGPATPTNQQIAAVSGPYAPVPSTGHVKGHRPRRSTGSALRSIIDEKIGPAFRNMGRRRPASLQANTGKAVIQSDSGTSQIVQEPESSQALDVPAETGGSVSEDYRVQMFDEYFENRDIVSALRSQSYE
jgi:hypothetical protein